uniref:Uncharacterized protein n=1 Tax=Ditylenchus dipsaci TaxID=166011 RepID=A0A915D8H9_9BILA
MSPDSAFEDDDETLPVLNTNADFSVPSFSRVFYADGKKEDEQVENSADCEDLITKDQPATSQEPVFVVDPNISPGTSDTEVTMQNAQLFESTSSQPYLHLPNSFDNVDFAEF